ncbi:hypothetical protein CRUP_020185 [Coryphaenoides rupestris]|nr:hypothetical protein CRUP_020185 [Coryphaenoides rupestris]
MAHEQNMDISKVAESGPGLAFIAYPRAVAMMPFPQLWAILFFIMIILLGLDSQFVGLEALTTAISDMNPTFFHTGHRRKILLLIISIGCFFVGLVMVTEGGLYIFQLFDYYACSGMTLLLFATLQSVCIGWVYVREEARLVELAHCVEEGGVEILGVQEHRRVHADDPIVYRRATFVFSLVKYTPLKFNNTLDYPWWGTVIGWWFTLSSTLLVPLWMIFKVAITPGTLPKRISTLCSPSDDLPLTRQAKAVKDVELKKPLNRKESLTQ